MQRYISFILPTDVEAAK